MLSGEATNINCIVFGLIRLEPTIYCTQAITPTMWLIFIDPAIVLSMFIFPFMFVIVSLCGLFEWKQICAWFFFYHLFISVLFPEIQLSREREGWDPTNQFNHITFVCLSLDFQCHMSWSFLCFCDMRRDVIVCFVDISRIVDHHCLNFLLIRYIYKIAKLKTRLS